MAKSDNSEGWSPPKVTRRLDQASGSGKARTADTATSPLEEAMRKNMPHPSSAEDYRHKGK
jgi:hypothetical protein